jgi:hypothetical protein
MRLPWHLRTLEACAVWTACSGLSALASDRIVYLPSSGRSSIVKEAVQSHKQGLTGPQSRLEALCPKSWEVADA